MGVVPSRLGAKKMQEYVFGSFFAGLSGLLEDGGFLSVHLDAILTFPSIDKGSGFLANHFF